MKSLSNFSKTTISKSEMKQVTGGGKCVRVPDPRIIVCIVEL
jgi:natural product precursor